MLGKNEIILKKYKFDYGNFLKCFFSHFCEVCLTISITCIIFLGYIFLFNSIENSLNNNILSKILTVFLTVFSVGLILFFAILPLIPKRAILTYNSLKIQRNSLIHDITERIGINDCIPYSTIESCDFCDDCIRINKNLPVVSFNWDSLIEIKDKWGRKYYVPVKNPEEFIEDVNKMVAIAKMKDNKENSNPESSTDYNFTV